MRVIAGVLVGLLTVAVFYAAFAFVVWEANPAQWSQDDRFGVALFSLCLGPFLGIVTAAWER